MASLPIFLEFHVALPPSAVTYIIGEKGAGECCKTKNENTSREAEDTENSKAAKRRGT